MKQAQFVLNDKHTLDCIGSYEVEVNSSYFDITSNTKKAKAIFPISREGDFRSCLVILYDTTETPVDGFLETNGEKVRKMFDVFTDKTQLCF